MAVENVDNSSELANSLFTELTVWDFDPRHPHF